MIQFLQAIHKKLLFFFLNFIYTFVIDSKKAGFNKFI